MKSSSLLLVVTCWVTSVIAAPLPIATDFSTKFDAFFAPSGNGYNWGHDWRAENYQNWVTAANRIVTASVQARHLAGRDFLVKVKIDPLELRGSNHTIALAAAGSDREFAGNVYLAEVKPESNRIRLDSGFTSAR